MDSWVWHQVSLELGDINVKGTVVDIDGDEMTRVIWQWIKERQAKISKQPMTGKRYIADEIDLIRQQVIFGWSSEDMEMQIADMASTGKETTFCMGDDAPLAVLSEKPDVLYNYFKQRFAQVTNPAIDPLRENLVMSLDMYLGKKGDAIVAEPNADNAAQIKIDSPVINEAELDQIKKARKTEIGRASCRERV